MKLLVIVNNSWSVHQEYMSTGILSQPKRRAIEITLTDEQVKSIGLLKIGKQNGQDMFEDIESISLTE